MSTSDEPAFRVVRGTPTPDELAAIVGVLWSRRFSAAPPPPPARSRWRDSALPHAGWRPGRGAWNDPSS